LLSRPPAWCSLAMGLIATFEWGLRHLHSSA
jgi:hypothetical protein